MELNDYRKKDFMPFCFEEIRLAFMSGIDPKLIEQYMNDISFDNLQLRQIRLGLEQGLDVSAYARTSMPYEEMDNIRERLLKEFNERNLEAEKEKKLEQQQIRTEVKRKKLNNTLSIFRISLKSSSEIGESLSSSRLSGFGAGLRAGTVWDFC